MPKTVSIQEAAELIAIVQHGEEVVIAQQDRPVAKLVSVPAPAGKSRRFGGYEGKIRISEDFDAPLPDEFWLGKSTA